MAALAVLITPLQLLDRFGYLAIGGLVLVEGFGVPAPGETVLVAGALSAGAGRLDVLAVGAVALLGAVCGDSIGYALGRFGGRRLALHYGRYLGLTHPRLARVERVFERHGGGIVAVARFVEGLRQFNGIVAGASGMRWWRFLAFNALGALLWVSTWTALGYLLGPAVADWYHAVRGYWPWALAVLAAAVVVAVLVHRRGR
ncbi:DedA family protein [Saccharopolyspora sp. HNM0983]|uniref:DedA family protein n=1 Tax=Saccharopolyspora montiporae TaxID=2781240 RepID=A0A929FZ28_9PSEU|nr:DedA family protein [Saccharopolyspora sp. HNM0983]